nr:DNA cytosine methyltransferase [Rhizobium sp. 16-449-1b]
MRYLSVCSGIEAATVAWHPLGWQAVAYSEIEKFPSAVLAHHYPDVPNLGDFTKIDVSTLGRVDILAGGTPCQAFSVAGLRQSLADARGNLSLEYVRLAHELAAHNGLRNAVWENVVGVLSTKDNAFGCFLAGLVGADAAIEPPRRGKWPGAGMVSGPKGRAAWRVLDAQYFGVAQRRRRVIVVADFGNGADPAAVLFERDGVRRYSPPSREAGKDVAGTTAGGVGGGCEWPAEVASTLNAAFGEKLGLENQHINSGAPLFVPQAVGVCGDVAHTLKAEGADASEDGTGRGTPIIAFDTTQITSALNRSVPKPGDPCHPLNSQAHPPAICFTAKDYGADASEELAPTLRAGGFTGSHANGGVMPAVTVAIRGRDGGATAELGGEVATSLRASQGGGDEPHVLAFDTYNQSTADTAATVRAGGGAEGVPAVLTSAVRRLTPRECERLQGFPDDYTAIPWGKKTADHCPDGPRYKALGNSWAAPKFAWLGKRIHRLMPANDNHRRSEENNLAA